MVHRRVSLSSSLSLSSSSLSLSSSSPPSSSRRRINSLRPTSNVLKKIEWVFILFGVFNIGFYGIELHKDNTDDPGTVELFGVGKDERKLQEHSTSEQRVLKSNAHAEHQKNDEERTPKNKIQSVNSTQIGIGTVIETTFEGSSKTINFQYNQSYDSFYNIPTDGTNLWDDISVTPHGNDIRRSTGVFHIEPTSNIPKWMKDYFNWHKSKQKQLRSIKEPTNASEVEQLIESERWLVMQCLRIDKTCGGTADRIKPILYMLRVAYESRRILFIRWTKPALLEEFLVPPVGGFDWRVPPWLGNALENSTLGRKFTPDRKIRQNAYGNLSLVRARYQSYNGGAAYYNTRLSHNELDFSYMFSTIWNIFFTPSQIIQQRIVEELDKYQLLPHHYTASHLRALYGRKDRREGEIFRWTEKLLKCASQLPQTVVTSSNKNQVNDNEYKIFFTSDSERATQYSEFISLQQDIQIVNRLNTTFPSPPLHLDKANDWRKRPVSHYYDTFIDLYIIALSGCVSYNKGGFGHWGLLIGGNLTCTHPTNKGQGRPIGGCEWSSSFPRNKNKDRNGPMTTSLTRIKATDLFLPEMESRWSNVNATT